MISGPCNTWNWVVLTDFNMQGINPTQFMSRNLIFNTEFQNFITAGNFQKFSGTLDITWKWPIFANFDVLGINST